MLTTIHADAIKQAWTINFSFAIIILRTACLKIHIMELLVLFTLPRHSKHPIRHLFIADNMGVRRNAVAAPPKKKKKTQTFQDLVMASGGNSHKS